MQKIQVQLLYTHYKWSTKQIAEFLDLPEAAVRMYLEEDGLLAPKKGELVTTGESDIDPYDDGIKSLKNKEVGKQLELAPIIATIELSLWQKMKDAVDACDSGNIDKLATVINSYKKLTQDSIINIAVKADKAVTTNSATFNVLAMKFND